MEILPELLKEFDPVDEHLEHIWERLPDATLEAEQERLRVRFLDIGSRLAGITQIMEAR